MQRNHRVVVILEGPSSGDIDRARPGQHRHERVDHDVADHDGPFGVETLGREVFKRVCRRHQEEIREPVREHAVDLLGHSPVVASQPSLHMGETTSKLVFELGRDESARERRIDVANHHDPVGSRADEHGFESLHHLRGLLCVRSGPHAERVIGFRQLQVTKKRVGHCRVGMLSGVNQQALMSRRAQRGKHGRHFHEVGAGPCDDQRFQSVRPPCGEMERRSTCPGRLYHVM